MSKAATDKQKCTQVNVWRREWGKERKREAFIHTETHQNIDWTHGELLEYRRLFQIEMLMGKWYLDCFYHVL